MDTPDLSISMVVYRPEVDALDKVLAALHRVLRSSQARRALRCHLWLIDNSACTQWPPRLQSCLERSFPGTPSISAELLVAPGNIGYGRGNNLAIGKTRSRYHFVSNPDIFPDDDALIEAIAYLEQHPRVGLLVPDVRGEDGERHHLCKRNPTLADMFLRGFAPTFVRRIFRRRMRAFEMRERDYDAVISPVEYPTGCFMFFRTEALQRIGGFDPDYFLYLEDADIGRRIGAIAEVAYVPRVRTIHQWAKGTHRSLRLRWATVWSALVYWRKWGGVF